MINSKATLTIFGDVIGGASKGNFKSVLSVASRVVAQAKALAPVQKKDGGRLRNSIMYELNNGDTGGRDDSQGEKSIAPINAKPPKNSAFVGFNLLYGIYQEYGTRKMKAQPFIRPAVAIEAMNADTKQILKEIAREEMEKALKEKRFVKVYGL
jgi:HK97 gp10 family phage protein